MNTPTIPKPKKSHSKTAAYLIWSAFRTLSKGHKKSAIEIIERMEVELKSIKLEIYRQREIDAFMKPKSPIKLICQHPCWIKN